MKNYVFQAEVEIVADNEDDARNYSRDLLEEVFAHDHVMVVHGGKPEEGELPWD